MQQILAPRINTMPAPMAQEHAATEHLLREQMDQPTSNNPYSSADAIAHSDNLSPVDHNNSDPMAHDPEGSGEGSADGRRGYGRRELSTSKRAAQNRAAQRAFRQRKEGYIKKLEEQVRDYGILSENFKAIQQENYQLRDYIINLQSRLLESQGEVPPPPSTLEGLQPGKPQQPNQATLPRLSELGAIQPSSTSSQPQHAPEQMTNDIPPFGQTLPEPRSRLQR